MTMKMLIQNSRGELLTTSVQATDTFRSLKDKMLKDYGLQMDFQNLCKPTEIRENDSIIDTLARNNRRLALEMDGNYSSMPQSIVKQTTAPGPSAVTTFGTIILQPQAVQPEEIYDSDEDTSVISGQSYAQETMKKTTDDQSLLCRLCATENNEMIPIFGENNTETEISRQILDCFSIVVRKTDIDKQICKSCMSELGKFHEFRRKILKINETSKLKRQTSEKPFSCDICDNSYTIQLERDNHRKIHTGKRLYNCPTCDKAFANTARLREHKRLHTDERHYKCKLCDKTFKRPSARKDHMTIHTGEQQHKCDLCSGTFKRMGDLRKHKKIMHNIDALVQ